MDQRLIDLEQWAKKQLQVAQLHITPLVADASFRRYFRLHTEQQSLIAMDAPPAQEPIANFIAVAQRLQQQQLRVPTILAQDIGQGFLLLTDFGNTLLLSALNDQNADSLYRRAMDDLLLMQQPLTAFDTTLPQFDASFILTELNNFKEWMVLRYLDDPLTVAEHQELEKSFQWLLQQALQQPEVFVHRDYHSRNLMVVDDQQLGILDFQDAVRGPITYDLVSLLRDCYIQWPLHQVEQWVAYFYQKLSQRSAVTFSLAEFMAWFDLMGVQRHLKASFIFARKWLRDQDPRYLGDIPRTLHYIQQVVGHYPELAAFADILQEKIVPAFEGVTTP